VSCRFARKLKWSIKLTLLALSAPVEPLCCLLFSGPREPRACRYSSLCEYPRAVVVPAEPLHPHRAHVALAPERIHAALRKTRMLTVAWNLYHLGFERERNRIWFCQKKREFGCEPDACCSIRLILQWFHTQLKKLRASRLDGVRLIERSRGSDPPS
jgi:hypothetical protein